MLLIFIHVNGGRTRKEGGETEGGSSHDTTQAADVVVGLVDVPSGVDFL